MQKKTILKWSYIRKVLSGFMQRLTGRSPKTYPTGKYYRSIDEMPLRVFIDIVCKQDLSVMAYDGRVSNDILAPVWDTILEQYLDATFSDEDRHLMSLLSKASLLEFNITKAKAIIKYLVYRHDREMITILVKMGAAEGPYPDQGTDTAKSNWMKRVVAKVKKWQHTLKELLAEIERIQPTGKEEINTISRSYFDDILTKLSHHFHFHIDENTVTVSRYLSMYKEFKNHLISLQKQAKTA